MKEHMKDIRREHVAFQNIATKCVDKDVVALVSVYADMETWPRVYKTVFMLNSTEHGISTAHKK